MLKADHDQLSHLTTLQGQYVSDWYRIVEVQNENGPLLLMRAQSTISTLGRFGGSGGTHVKERWLREDREELQAWTSSRVRAARDSTIQGGGNAVENSAAGQEPEDGSR